MIKERKTSHRFGKGALKALCMALVCAAAAAGWSPAMVPGAYAATGQAEETAAVSEQQEAAFTAMAATTTGTTSAAAQTTTTTTTTTTTAKTTKLTDIKGHWAESYINKAVTSGFVTGYEDGTFKPNKEITRAEFVTMMNLAIGNNGTESTDFTDVGIFDWYTPQVNKAVYATYVSGYEDNTFRPNNNITRQEAAVMIARIVPNFLSEKDVTGYPDAGSISSWALEAFEKVYGKGYIGSYNDGYLHPKDNLTRAQAAKIIDDILDNEKIYTSNLEVQKAGISISNCIIANNLTIGTTVGEGSVTLSNCTILGMFTINAGGTTDADAVYVMNTRIAEASVNKQEKAVRVIVTGQSCIKNMDAQEIPDIVHKDLTGGTFGTGIECLNLKRAADASLTGNFLLVNIVGSKVDLDIISGNITGLIVYEDCKLGTVAMAEGTTISEASVNSQCAFTGPGKVSTMYVNATGITYETKPDQVIIADGINAAENGSTTGAAATTSGALTPINIMTTPESGSAGVDVGTTIIVSFDEAIMRNDGAEITASQIPALISLRKDSASGTEVGYTSSIDTAKTIITIKPDGNLTKDTLYFLTIPAGVFKTASGRLNNDITVNFSTGEPVSSLVTFSPAAGETVAANAELTLTFKTPVMRYSGAQITTEYLSDAIALKKDSALGTNVAFTGSLDSTGTVITIKPTKVLEEACSFYFGIKASKIKTSAGEVIPATGITFKTSSDSLKDIAVDAADTTAQLTCSSNMTGTVYAAVYRRDSVQTELPSASKIIAGTNATAYTNSPIVAGGSATLMFSNLSTDTKYTACVVLKDSYGTCYTVFSRDFATDSMRLNSLEILPVDSNGNYSQNVLTNFKGSQSSYTVSLPAGTEKVRITPDAGTFSGKLTVTFNGKDLNYATELASITKESNSVIVTVSASGKTSKSYTVTLKTAPTITGFYYNGSSNNVVSDGQYSYTVNIGSATSINLSARLNAQGSFELRTSTGTLVSSGTASSTESGQMQITPGTETAFILTVYNSDKTAHTDYNIYLNRY